MKNSTSPTFSCIFFLMLFIINNTHAQFNQGSVISTCEVCVPVDVTGGDLNNDGYPDVITASYYDNKISYYPNNQSGGFLGQQIISTELEGARTLFIADLNGDGNADILAAGLGEQIVWFENMGNNEFTDAQIVSNAISGVADLLAIDLDGDADMDVIAASSSEDKFVWFENDGTGSFSAEKILTTEVDKAWKVAANDMDGDLDIDIVVLSNSDAKVAWYENLGEGSFSEERLIDNSISVVNSIAIGDYDADGDIDVISGSNFRGTLTYYANDGSGNFSAGVTIAEDRIDISNIYAADIDKDSHLDILTISDLDEDLSWYRNDGTGSFEDRAIIRNDLDLINAAVATDFDLDGTCDIVYTTELNNLGFLKNEGQEKFDTLIDITDNLSSFEQFLFLESADLNQDGFIDVLATGNNRVVWFKNNGNKGFSKAQRISLHKGLTSHVVAIDVDNDGDKDVVYNDTEEEVLYWSKNDGTGTFTQTNIIEEDIFAYSFSFSDVDKDGDNDLLVANTNFGNNNLSIFLNDGLGNFTQQETPLKENLEVSAAGFEDLDNDGSPDLIIASLDEGLFIIRNGADGTSVEQNLMVSLGYPGTYEAVDIDGDEDKDLLVISDGRFFIFINDGEDFEFRDFISIDEIARILPVDIDGDNDMDIITGVEGNVVWLANDGQGNFSQQQTLSDYLEGDLVRDLVAFDVDNDGDQDIVAASGYFATITWFENILDAPSITGLAYSDENGNGEKDTEESTLRNLPIYLLPDSLITFTNSEGYYEFFVPEGNYSIQSPSTKCWENSSNNSTANFEVKKDTTIIRNIGFRKQSDNQHTQVRIQSARTRCGFDVPFVLSVENDGCTPSKGKVGLVLNGLVTFVAAQPMPIEINEDTLIWNYESLESQEIVTIPLTMTIAGAEFLGEVLELEGISYIENVEGGLEVSSTFSYSSEIRCAYDPNDKLVTPNRLSEYNQNYTLFSESMEYTIRFQNTGNDTAFNVVIRDTLDKNLDWATFKPILASHPFGTFLDKDGQVSFSFNDILLPDSTTNEPLSHGFVTYKIQPKKDLPENTIIENTAGIYFDFNPPIITNTTENILVSALPRTTSLSEFSLAQTVKVYPNPFGDFLTIELVESQTDILPELSIFDVTGRQVQTTIIKSSSQQISTTPIAKGIYFYQVISRDGQMIANGKVVKQ